MGENVCNKMTYRSTVTFIAFAGVITMFSLLVWYTSHASTTTAAPTFAPTTTPTGSPTNSPA